MSEPDKPSLDELLERLETGIALLSEGSAPLEELVHAHEEAQRLVEAAARQLAELEAWAAGAAVEAPPPGSAEGEDS